MKFSRRRLMVALVVGVITVFGCVKLWHRPVAALNPGVAQTTPAPVTPPDRFGNTGRTLDAYVKIHQRNRDNYFLFAELMQDPLASGEQMTRFEKRLLEIKKKYADVNVFSRQINEHFGGFCMEIFWNGEGMTPSTYTPLPVETMGRDRLLVGLIPKEMVTHPILRRHNFIYKRFPQPGRAPGAITITAVEWSETILAGRLYHEMGHAYRHQVSHTETGGHLSGPIADATAAEEVEMYMLSRDILNAASQGDFTRLLNKVIDRTLGTDFEQSRDLIFNSIKLEDLMEMDQILGLQTDADQTTRANIGEFLVQLGLRLVERTHDDSSRQAALIQQYRWFAEVFKPETERAPSTENR